MCVREVCSPMSLNSTETELRDTQLFLLHTGSSKHSLGFDPCEYSPQSFALSFSFEIKQNSAKTTAHQNHRKPWLWLRFDMEARNTVHRFNQNWGTVLLVMKCSKISSKTSQFLCKEKLWKFCLVWCFVLNILHSSNQACKFFDYKHWIKGMRVGTN